MAKRGKLAGTKQVYRSRDGEHHVVRQGHPGPTDGKALLESVIRDGEIVTDITLDAAIERAERDADRVDPEWESAE